MIFNCHYPTATKTQIIHPIFIGSQSLKSAQSQFSLPTINKQNSSPKSDHSSMFKNAQLKFPRTKSSLILVLPLPNHNVLSYVQRGSLILASSLMNFCVFLHSSDYILYFYLPFSTQPRITSLLLITRTAWLYSTRFGIALPF